MGYLLGLIFAADAVSWIIEHGTIIVGGLVGLILLIVLLKHGRKARARHKAALAYEEAERKRKEEEEKARREEVRKQEEEKAKQAAIEARIQAAISQNPGSEKYRLARAEMNFSGDLLDYDAFGPISLRRYVAFDTETTGLDHNRDAIVEIAAARVVDGVVVDTFQQLVHPGMLIPDEASKVNHITFDMVVLQPHIEEVLPAFLNFVGDDVLAAHNARFDARFLAQACLKWRFKTPQKYFDTMTLARYWPESEKKSLEALAKAAKIENPEAHRALGDALTVAELIRKTNVRREALKNLETEK